MMSTNYIKLNNDSLQLLKNRIKLPGYNRAEISSGIVHIGVGNFHRSHEAFYTNYILQQGAVNWGICGIGLLPGDKKMYDILKAQDGLYTLMILNPDGNVETEIIGSIVELIYAPGDPGKAIEKMAGPDIRIISLTITEGGYNFDPYTGEFNFKDPGIQHDLLYPEFPVTVFGYLTSALRLRSERGGTGLTILSCDNIQHNGEMAKKTLLAFLSEADPALKEWVSSNVSFPNSMVDRITPGTTTSNIAELELLSGIHDDWPVPCEPFVQWVIEDDFRAGRPEWERTNVQFVLDVSPYEKMKIRLLNAGHSLLGLCGTLMGYHTINESVNDKIIRSLLLRFYNEEVLPILGSLEIIDLNVYIKDLLQRFGNAAIKDNLSRICSESSAKLPKFLLPTLNEELKRGGPIEVSTFIIAAWCHYLELNGNGIYNYEIIDLDKDKLIHYAIASKTGDPLYFLDQEEIFGNLKNSVRFTGIYNNFIKEIRQSGFERVIIKLSKLENR